MAPEGYLTMHGDHAPQATERLGLEWLGEIGLPPTDLVSLAADVGCRHISTILQRIDLNPFGYPTWSLLDDAALRREMKTRMLDRGISISLGEGCVIRPDADVSDHKRALEVFVELGTTRVNTVSFDPDHQRTFDQFSKLAEMTRDAGLELTAEFVPMLTISTMDYVIDLITRVGQPHVKVLIDTMHFVRAGHKAEEIARHDPAIFGYIQISDGPLVGGEDYMDEAMNDRMIPGEGEMPLRDIIAALPADPVVSMEVPLNRMAAGGMSALERASRTASATRAILASI
jgi:sugar phosphate isomerase/epimerase